MRRWGHNARVRPLPGIPVSALLTGCWAPPSSSPPLRERRGASGPSLPAGGTRKEGAVARKRELAVPGVRGLRCFLETRGAPAAGASEGRPRATASVAYPRAARAAQRGGRGLAARGQLTVSSRLAHGYLRDPSAQPERGEEQVLGTRPPPPRPASYGFTSFTVKCEERDSTGHLGKRKVRVELRFRAVQRLLYSRPPGPSSRSREPPRPRHPAAQRRQR